MAKFEINSWGYYEIDFYNHGTESELEHLLKLDKYCTGTFYKDRDKWISISSGMSFNISNMSYYPKLKEYLDYRLNIHLRKSKLQKI